MSLEIDNGVAGGLWLFVGGIIAFRYQGKVRAAAEEKRELGVKAPDSGGHLTRLAFTQTAGWIALYVVLAVIF